MPLVQKRLAETIITLLRTTIEEEFRAAMRLSMLSLLTVTFKKEEPLPDHV
jgi:hypothetical protein